ncbi:MAG: LPS assembly protein LptD [Gammaproteobacteria bacterium]|nr:LPS assembly protein LptD [Gammaproteobacteria bacterium]
MKLKTILHVCNFSSLIALLCTTVLLSSPVIAADKSKSKSKLGWECKAGDDGESWDCKRSGPISDQLAISDQEKAVQQAATITPQDEVRFEALLSNLDLNPWASCESISEPIRRLPTLQPRDEAQVNVGADYVEAQEREVTTFIGNVDITRADQRIKAHYATYDAIAETVQARDDVVYLEHGMALQSDTLFLNLQNSTGKLRNAIFIVNSIPARAQARTAFFESMTLSRYEDAAYTTCPPGNQDWVVHAEKLKLDREQGWGIAHNAWLNFMDVPFLYTPYMSFPLDDRRKSGFLAVSFDSSQESGFGVTVPYYWSIAPNFDATIAPRFLTGRGLMLGGEFRYLTSQSAGELAAEVLTYDTQKKQPRGQVSFLHRTVFSPELRANIDAHFVSDDDYLDQLGNTLGVTNNRHVRSQARLDYVNEHFSLLTRVENYQTIDDTIPNEERPYRRLPQILFTTSKPVWDTGILADLNTEFTFFHQNNRVTGQRLDVRPSLAFPIDREYGYIHPKISMAHTQYWYNGSNTGPIQSDGSFREFSDTNSRTLPIASLDASLFLEQDLSIGSNQFLHTIQPRLFYVYIPEKNQNDIPLFDTNENDFTFYQMFRENRFAGGDRIGDTNHLTAAVTSSILDAETGREQLRVSIGEIFYFKDREVTLFGRECLEQRFTNDIRCQKDNNDFSNVIAEISATLTDTLKVFGAIYWDPISKSVRRRQFELQYHDDMNRIFNIGYRFRNDTGNQADTFNRTDTLVDRIDGSFHLPIFKHWNIIGRMQYSFNNNIILDSFLGFEHDNCCWRLRVIGRHFINDFSEASNQENSHANNAIFVQLELKGLASFGNKKVGKYLERNIKNYYVSKY